jgi:hypothetical protein
MVKKKRSERKKPSFALRTQVRWKQRGGSRCFLKMLTKNELGIHIYIRCISSYKLSLEQKYGHYLMIKCSIHQEHIKIFNEYIHNLGALNIHSNFFYCATLHCGILQRFLQWMDMKNKDVAMQ